MFKILYLRTYSLIFGSEYKSLAMFTRNHLIVAMEQQNRMVSVRCVSVGKMYDLPSLLMKMNEIMCCSKKARFRMDKYSIMLKARRSVVASSFI